MKKIVLKQLSQNTEGYTVSLGNGSLHTFPSKRKAQDYLNQTNKFLSTQLFEVHGIYMALWQEYQRVWFYFGFGTEKGKWTLHHLSKQRCEESLKSCEECIEQAFNKSDYEMGNQFTFQNIRVAINQLKIAVKILMPLFSKRSQTADIYRLNSFIARLIEIENKINAYGQLEATTYTTIPTYQKQTA